LCARPSSPMRHARTRTRRPSGETDTTGAPWNRSLGRLSQEKRRPAGGLLPGSQPSRVTRDSETGDASGATAGQFGKQGCTRGNGTLPCWGVVRPKRELRAAGWGMGLQSRVGALYGRGRGGIWCHVRCSALVAAGGWLRFPEGPGGEVEGREGSESGQPGQRGLGETWHRRVLPVSGRGHGGYAAS
jgi:hypothetical protein